MKKSESESMDPFGGLIDSCSLWTKCEANLFQNEESYELKIILQDDSLAGAFLVITNVLTSIRCVFKLNCLVEVSFDSTHLLLNFLDYDEMKLLFLVTNTYDFEILISQIQVCSKISKNVDDEFKENNMRVLQEICISNDFIPNIQWMGFDHVTCGATPVLNNFEARKTWERRSLWINSTYINNLFPIRICCFTWNVGGCKPNDTTADEFDSILLMEPDILFVAFQEISMNLKSTVAGSSPVAFEWENQLLNALSGSDIKYRLETPQALGGVFSAFIIKESLPFNIVVEKPTHIRLGVHGMTANKSALLFKVNVGNYATLNFVGCHLSAHQENIEQRNQQLISLSKRVDSKSDYLILIGDLNYRIDLTYEEAIDGIQKLDINKLIENDQLKKEMKNRLSFYNEADIEFLPSYKFDPNSDIYDTSPKHRVPSYTDRVLFHTYPPRLAVGSADHFSFETDIVMHFAPNLLKTPSPTYFSTGDFPLNFPQEPLVEVYKSNNCKLSDHRPVQCVMKINIPIEDSEKLTEFQNLKLKKLDEMSILATPKLIISKSNIEIKIGTPVEIIIKNVSIAWARFSVKLQDEFKGSLKVIPSDDVILPGREKILTIYGQKPTKTNFFILLMCEDLLIGTIEAKVTKKKLKLF